VSPTFAARSSWAIPGRDGVYARLVSDLGRIRHYGEFYGQHADAPSGRPEMNLPLWLVVGNCQAEALRQALDAVTGRPYRTVRVPPVHEIGADDLPHLHALLSKTAVLLTQPVRSDYRDLPLGTTQLATRLPKAAKVLRWPVIRYAGLYPFQVIVRRPADRSIVPPAVPYHDLRTIAAALAGRSFSDPWDVDVEPARFRAVAEASSATLAERERRGCDVGVSDTLASAGADAAHAINHPGNTVLATLARRVLTELGVLARPDDSALGADPLLGSVYVPLEQRVLDALGIDGRARTRWHFHGESIDAERVHRIQMNWYLDNPDFLQLAVDRHRSTMDLLGLPIGGATR
jgi:Polysaccharide biosynthesis enzyme WcbI